MVDNHQVPMSIEDSTDLAPEQADAAAQAPSAAGPDPAEQPSDESAVPADAVCAGAVTLARRAALEVAGPGHVGDHVGTTAEGERLVSHHFDCRTPGYRGWRWAVTLARAPRARTATVCEVVLLPGPTSVLAPAWLPWSDRITPGDLGPADQLAYRVDDPNLEPGYTLTGEEDEDRLGIWELGLGRPRVLSPPGRAELARRWYASDRGPTSDEAVHAQAACSSCGYFLPLAGALRAMFGVCGNEWSPSDARVVSADHGCGAHSETGIDRPPPEHLPPLIIDETGAEAVVLPPRAPATTPSRATLAKPVPRPGGPQDEGDQRGTAGGSLILNPSFWTRSTPVSQDEVPARRDGQTVPIRGGGRTSQVLSGRDGPASRTRTGPGR